MMVSRSRPLIPADVQQDQVHVLPLEDASPSSPVAAVTTRYSRFRIAVSVSRMPSSSSTMRTVLILGPMDLRESATL